MNSTTVLSGKNELSDEKLVTLACSGDDSAMATLISRLAPLVKVRAATVGGTLVEPEDLAQEGMMGFLDAVNNFKVDGGASFRTYAVTCIDNRITTAIRRQIRVKDIPKNSLISINQDGMDIEAVGADPQEIVSRQEETARLNRILDELLSKMERKVIHYYLAGRSYEQIANSLNITAKAVDNALQRIKRKLRALGR
ncbi:MAG TPA: sigma-70 family RNA polymerase sigma factor [Clostridia bacterium]|nr:sigma-70 family RNA polymerase sigma factor [Clostridia bacterium]